MSLLSRLFSISDEDMEFTNKIQELRKDYPSLKVVGRGGIYVDPQEIIDSPEFKKNLDNTKKLIKA